jgi:SAM-dependent methyltransferase
MTTLANTIDLVVQDKLRALWALGDYARVATEVIPALGRDLVTACQIQPGERVLDVAAGSGNAAVPAARAGARVVASDVCPELLDEGAAAAQAAGVAGIEWQPGNAEALPYADDEFDVVMSCVGAMFAPRHELVAAELLRVCRSGGRLGLINWTPGGFIGQMFGTLKPYAPPPPPGASPPPLWGQEDHVIRLLGDGVQDVVLTRHTVRIDQFADAVDFRDYFKANYGPTIATYRNIADDPARVAALDRALVELAARHDLGGGVMEWEYLLVTAVVR